MRRRLAFSALADVCLVAGQWFWGKGEHVALRTKRESWRIVFLLTGMVLAGMAAGCSDPSGNAALPVLSEEGSDSSGEDEFWRQIATIDVRALRRGDEDAAVLPLFESLAQSSQQEIEQFQEHLATALYQLDGRSYADNAGASGNSGDGFLYARCYVVALGKKKYAATLNDPSRMPTNVNQWFESLLYVAGNAWAEATGNEPDAWDFDTSHSYETKSNTEQW